MIYTAKSVYRRREKCILQPVFGQNKLTKKKGRGPGGRREISLSLYEGRAVCQRSFGLEVKRRCSGLAVGGSGGLFGLTRRGRGDAPCCREPDGVTFLFLIKSNNPL